MHAGFLYQVTISSSVPDAVLWSLYIYIFSIQVTLSDWIRHRIHEKSEKSGAHQWGNLYRRKKPGKQTSCDCKNCRVSGDISRYGRHCLKYTITIALHPPLHRTCISQVKDAMCCSSGWTIIPKLNILNTCGPSSSCMQGPVILSTKLNRQFWDISILQIWFFIIKINIVCDD